MREVCVQAQAAHNGGPKVPSHLQRIVDSREARSPKMTPDSAGVLYDRHDGSVHARVRIVRSAV